MEYTSFDNFLKTGTQALEKGPVAMIFVEDEVEIATTMRHHLQCGFHAVLALMPDAMLLPADVEGNIHRIPFDCGPEDAVVEAINALIEAAPGIWMYYCFNAEYLFYPFCETRSIGEMLAFHGEELRDAMLTYVIDLYADDLDAFPNAVSLDRAHLDKSGYYAQSRKAPDTG
ncbi:MAG: hypothetical protein AAF408_17545, partial [Pseudomonadota bacterium]